MTHAIDLPELVESLCDEALSIYSFHSDEPDPDIVVKFFGTSIMIDIFDSRRSYSWLVMLENSIFARKHTLQCFSIWENAWSKS